MNNPAISVVIPCYNQGRYLQEAVDSILNQTFRDLEIIVVNDGSAEPESTTILKGFQAEKTTVLHQENRGVSAARNAGIAAARGKYVFTLDADDLLLPSFLEKAHTLMEADPGLGLVTCDARRFGEQEKNWDQDDPTLENLLLGNCIPSSCALFRRADWEQTGGFDRNLTIAEDLDFWLCIAELGRTGQRIPERLFLHRVHAESAIRRFNKLGKRENYLFERDMYAYIVKKHIKLYAACPDLLARKLFPYAVRKPKNLRLKRLKYRLQLALLSLLGKGPGHKKYETARRKLDNLNLYLEHTRDYTVLELD